MKLSLIILSIFLASCAKGPKGDKGDAGAPGSSCSITQVSNGAIINCQDGTSAVLLNGTNGQDGAPAPATPYSVTEVIVPCGIQPGFNEVLLRTHNNALIAHFAQGNLQFLTLLSPGSYITTDSKRCRFNVDSNLNVTW